MNLVITLVLFAALTISFVIANEPLTLHGPIVKHEDLPTHDTPEIRKIMRCDICVLVAKEASDLLANDGLRHYEKGLHNLCEAEYTKYGLVMVPNEPRDPTPHLAQITHRVEDPALYKAAWIHSFFREKCNEFISGKITDLVARAKEKAGLSNAIAIEVLKCGEACIGAIVPTWDYDFTANLQGWGEL